MKPEPNQIIQGNCIDVMKKWNDGCIDMCISSPPYWSLRKYDAPDLIFDGDGNCDHEWGNKLKSNEGYNNTGKRWQHGKSRETDPETWNKNISQGNFCLKCGAWKGQLGLEPTFDLYIKHLCDIYDGVKRVLKKEGSIWVNLGDTYGTHTSKRSGQFGSDMDEDINAVFANKRPNLGFEKSLCLIPQRFAIEMVNRGWILRNVIIWHKPNPMPSSAKDRFTVDFEYLFFFVKNKKYYFEQQFEDVKQCSIERLNRAVSNKNKWVDGADGQTKQGISQPRPNKNKYKGGGQKGREENCAISTHRFDDGDYLVAPFNPQGRNMRCVWTIPTMPCSEAHFAVYPERLIETPIKSGCPEFICEKCGKAREKIWEKGKLVPDEPHYKPRGKNRGDKYVKNAMTPAGEKQGHPNFHYENKFKGYTTCDCENPTYKPGIVLDLFAGRGTTGIVAQRLGKSYILIELSEEYVKLIKKNLSQGWLC